MGLLYKTWHLATSISTICSLIMRYDLNVGLAIMRSACFASTTIFTLHCLRKFCINLPNKEFTMNLKKLRSNDDFASWRRFVLKSMYGTSQAFCTKRSTL